jgi:hypothetical protein
MEEVIRNRRHKALVERLLTGASHDELLTELSGHLSPEEAAWAIDEAKAEIVSRSSSPYFPETAQQVAYRKFSLGYNVIRLLATLLIVTGVGGIFDLLSGTPSVELLNVMLGLALFAIATWRLRRRMREARENLDRLIAPASGTHGAA